MNYLFKFETLILHIISLDIVLGSVAIVLLLFCTAIMSAAEVAFFSLTKIDLDDFKNNPTNNSQLLIGLLEDPKKLLANILVANNAINILVVLLFTSVGDEVFKVFNYAVDLYFFEMNLRFLIEVVVVTFLILLFGEVLPKIYANRNPKKIALLTTPFIKISGGIFYMVSAPLTWLSAVVEKRLRNSKSNLSVEDLSQALELTSETTTTTEQIDILKGIVNFGNTETVQIMHHRTDICAISNKESFQKVLAMIRDKGFSRNPVYNNNIDEIVGVLYAKDLLPYIHNQDFDWLSLVREPFFIPENKKLDDLLNDFKEKKNHLAIVVDEYGGTSGLVTLEDVIEEIVGDISDEFDEEDLQYSKIDDRNYVFDGKINIKDFCKIVSLEEAVFEKDKGESETIAGLLLEVSGKFPKKHEKINYLNFTFTIESLEKRRIKQVKVTVNE